MIVKIDVFVGDKVNEVIAVKVAHELSNLEPIEQNIVNDDFAVQYLEDVCDGKEVALFGIDNILQVNEYITKRS